MSLSFKLLNIASLNFKLVLGLSWLTEVYFCFFQLGVLVHLFLVVSILN